MDKVDIERAAHRMADLVVDTPDDLLSGPTPCRDYRLADLLDHISSLSVAFTAAATKDTAGIGERPPRGDASQLGDDWRTRIPHELEALAEAWRDPAAWSGMTLVGGSDLPGEVAGIVGLDELVIHGWDLARATGQAYHCDGPTLEVCHGFVAQFSEPGREEARARLFGPELQVAPDAPLLDRVVALSGRDPAWSTPRSR